MIPSYLRAAISPASELGIGRRPVSNIPICYTISLLNDSRSGSSNSETLTVVKLTSGIMWKPGAAPVLFYRR